MKDRFNRPLRDLRISVIDRCNYRCPYCMPADVYGEGYKFLPRSHWLTAGEIKRVAGLFLQLGVRKVRLTGGEPLLRKDIVEIVAALIGSVDSTISRSRPTARGSPSMPLALKAAGSEAHHREPRQPRRSGVPRDERRPRRRRDRAARNRRRSRPQALRR